MKNFNTRFEHVRKIGTQRKSLQDIYHTLLACRWSVFFLIYIGFFVCFNFLFALLYWSQPNSIHGSEGTLWEAFSFSVQTFSTVGYGVLSPGSGFAHGVVVVESILAVFVTAVLTGLIFSKFSRPSARILFSNHILITNFDNQRTLMLRVGNLRSNQILEAEVKIAVLKTYVTADGHRLRKQIDLKLVRSRSLFFSLTWTIMHIIDEESPLFQLSSGDCEKSDLEIAVAMTGYDTTFFQTVHANVIYGVEEIVFDRHFEDLFTKMPNQIMTIDYRKFHQLKNV